MPHIFHNLPKIGKNHGILIPISDLLSPAQQHYVRLDHPFPAHEFTAINQKAHQIANQLSNGTIRIQHFHHKLGLTSSIQSTDFFLYKFNSGRLDTDSSGRLIKYRPSIRRHRSVLNNCLTQASEQISHMRNSISHIGSSISHVFDRQSHYSHPSSAEVWELHRPDIGPLEFAVAFTLAIVLGLVTGGIGFLLVMYLVVT